MFDPAGTGYQAVSDSVCAVLIFAVLPLLFDPLSDGICCVVAAQVVRPYQSVGNPLSKRACLNGLHSHFLLVDDGTLGKQGDQMQLRARLERLLQLQKIHPSE